MFQRSSELKKEYLEQFATGTAKSRVFILRLVDEYETKLGKDVFDFTLVELKTMIATQFRNTSIGSVQTNVSIIRSYVDFCIGKNEVLHNTNWLAVLDKEDLQQFVSKKVVEYKYITRKELNEYQDMLVNAQDIALIELLYLGVRGRTEKGASFEEIINLKIDPLSDDFNNNILKLEKNNGQVRFLEVSSRTIGIVLDAYNQEQYLTDNGDSSSRVTSRVVNKLDNYVFRKSGGKIFSQFESDTVQSRVAKIQKWCGNKFITAYNLYMSGMIDMALDIYNKKGGLIPDDYIEICEAYDYGGENAKRNIWVVRDHVVPHLPK